MPVATYPMTYDSLTQLLTIFGNSNSALYDYMGYDESTAFTFEHIKEFAIHTDPSLANSVGYEFNFRIQFDANLTFANETWFKDTLKFVKMNRHINTGSMIWVNNGCTFQLGELIDENNKTTKDGCVIYFGGAESTVSASEPFRYGFRGGGAAVVNIFSSVIGMLAPWNTITVASISNLPAKIWNSKLFGGGIYGSLTTADTYNCDLENIQRALFYADGTFNNLRVSGCIHPAIIRRPNLSSTVQNVIARNNSYMAGIQNASGDGGFLRMIDCDFDNWGSFLTTAPTAGVTLYFYRDHTLNLTVLDTSGVALENVNVIIKDVSNNIIADLFTDSSGKITQQQFTVYQWNMSNNGGVQQIDTINYNPFLITINKEGYQIYTLSLDILKPEKLIVAILEIPAPIYIQDDQRISSSLDDLTSASIISENDSRLTGISALSINSDLGEVGATISIIEEIEVVGEISIIET